MDELFLNKEHIARFNYMMDELSFTDLRDPYWRSLVFGSSTFSVGREKYN